MSPSELERKKPTGGLRLEGQVIDEQQQPVAGAEVSLWPGDHYATSERDGSFAFDGLIALRYNLMAAKEDLFSDVATVRLSTTSEPLILRMRRGATLVMHVVEDRSPVEGAKVVLDGHASAVTDRSGTARIGGLGPHFHLVDVTADDRVPEAVSMMLGEDPGGTDRADGELPASWRAG